MHGKYFSEAEDYTFILQKIKMEPGWDWENDKSHNISGSVWAQVLSNLWFQGFLWLLVDE